MIQNSDAFWTYQGPLVPPSAYIYLMFRKPSGDIRVTDSESSCTLCSFVACVNANRDSFLLSPYMVVWHVNTEIMLVIISLLEDEQQLSLGMLIHPKRIYNYCLLHACFVWLWHVLNEHTYTFDHILTNLLTQYTQLPVPVFCCFCISGFPPLKVHKKFQKNYIKNQHTRSIRNHQGKKGGPPQGL